MMEIIKVIKTYGTNYSKFNFEHADELLSYFLGEDRYDSICTIFSDPTEEIEIDVKSFLREAVELGVEFIPEENFIKEIYNACKEHDGDWLYLRFY